MAELFTAVCWLVIALLSRPFPLTTLLLLVVVALEILEVQVVVQADCAQLSLQLAVVEL
jgi:hypothetical protein